MRSESSPLRSTSASPEADADCAAVEWLAQVDESEVILSVVTFAQLRRGIERLPAATRRRRPDEWLQIARSVADPSMRRMRSPPPRRNGMTSPRWPETRRTFRQVLTSSADPAGSFRGNVTEDSGIVTGDSGRKPEIGHLPAE